MVPLSTKPLPRSSLVEACSRALDARVALLDPAHNTALRLFNGPLEGPVSIVLDLYAHTLVVHDATERSDEDRALVHALVDLVCGRWSWIRSVVWKARRAEESDQRNGILLVGTAEDVATEVTEAGVRYALRLTMNRDASLYLDTRGLRTWARETLRGARVLNTFAYTGSLGVAARAGGALRVLQVDRNAMFLDVARRSCERNGWAARKQDFRAGDYFTVTAQLRRERQLFDCVMVDPPLFSVTQAGRVDMLHNAVRVIEKAFPLVADHGALVVVNNALFVSGAAWDAMLQQVCAKGYAVMEKRIDVPEDCIGYPSTRCAELPENPAPFNHATKIAVLRVRRKDARSA